MSRSGHLESHSGGKGHTVERWAQARRMLRSRRPVRMVTAGAALAVLGLVSPAITAAAAGPYTPGTLFVADQDCACVWQIAPGGSEQSVWQGINESPQDVVTDAVGDVFWTQDAPGIGEVVEYTAGGSLVTWTSSLEYPWGIAVNSAGTDVYVGAESGPEAGQEFGLYELTSPGATPTEITGTYGEFTSLAVDGNGDIYGAAGGDSLVEIPAGSSTGAAVDVPGGSFAGQYSEVNGVSLDAADNLYTSDAYGDNAVELPAGSATSVALATGLNYTEGIAVDTNGNVFVGQPSTVSDYGKIFEISGGSQALYSQGELAYTGGIAVYPPPVPAVRSTTSTTLTTTSPSTVTTLTKMTLKATVSGASSGTVQFDLNNSPLGAPVAVSAGTAKLTTTLPQGTDNVTATFLGSSSGAPSTSPTALTFTADGVASHTTLTSTATTWPGDEDATVTVTVVGSKTGPTPTGSVTVAIKGNEVTSGELSDGSATLSFPLSPGTSKITASYQGDNVYSASSSKTLTLKTEPPYAPTLNTKVKYGTKQSNGSKPATVTVTVSGAKGLPAPTGSVTASNGFSCGALNVGGGVSSTATCSGVLPKNQSEDGSINYSGDSTFDPASTDVYLSNGGGGD